MTQNPREKYKLLDPVYLKLDREWIRRARNLLMIPSEDNRQGGKYAYGEWAHVIGIFQTLINLHAPDLQDLQVLDVGCGTGLMGIACEPFLGSKGRYLGIDVSRRDIEFCQSHYPSDRFEFKHIDVSNAFYAPTQQPQRLKWDLSDATFDLVTALSVWAHFTEEDALFYLGEVARVLKPGGCAIITFFLLDALYRQHTSRIQNQAGRFHADTDRVWLFDKPQPGSGNWWSPAWAEVAESAIGIDESGFERLVRHSGLDMTAQFPGNWKEFPGVYFQDICVFRKDY